MSDNKLPPENQRLLEILLKPGMREYMRESARKAFDIPKLKKWLEDGAPYEEQEEALVYREYKEREARKNDGSAGVVGEGSVGAIRCNYNNGGKRANGTAHRTYSNNEPKTGKTSSPYASTNNQHIGTIYKNYQHSCKFLDQKVFPIQATYLNDMLTHLNRLNEPIKKIYRENDKSKHQGIQKGSDKVRPARTD